LWRYNAAATAMVLQKILAQRPLIASFVRRDIQSRYRGSIAGLLWTVLNPLLLLGLFTFVFSIILKIRLGPESGTTEFALFVFCGLLPLTAIQEGLTRSTHVLIDNANLIKRSLFPAFVLPVPPALAAVVQQAIGTGVLILALLATGHGLSVFFPLLAVVMLLQVVFTVGLGWLLASLTVFFRDIGQFLGLAFTLWMFITPIVYPPSMMPEDLRFLLAINPLALLVESYRALLLQGSLPPLTHLLWLAVFAGASGLAGYLTFSKLEPAFADVL
jgi:lipopolysaccharide transport system permease protein